MKSLVFVIMTILSFTATAQNVKTFIPERAKELMPIILKEVDQYLPHHPERAYMPALFEHESCISLRHSRCYRSDSELRSQREIGVGIGQLTKTFNPDGSIRFDKLTELRNAYREELKELSWSTVKHRPDLQIRASVLLVRSDYNALHMVKDPIARAHFTDAAYNGGRGGVQKERTACGLAKDCDPQQWFGHVERYCLKSKKALYGNRSACDINRHHVHDVFYIRLPKYSRYIESLGEQP